MNNFIRTFLIMVIAVIFTVNSANAETFKFKKKTEPSATKNYEVKKPKFKPAKTKSSKIESPSILSSEESYKNERDSLESSNLQNIRASRAVIGVGAGSTGVDATVGYQISDYFKVKVNYYNTLKYEREFQADDMDLNFTFDFSGVGLLADIHPFAGTFRITGGVYQTDNNIGMTATLDGLTAEIGNTSYTFGATDKVVGTAKYDSIAPYLGIGWDIPLFTDVARLTTDFGVLNVGDLEVTSLQYSGATSVSLADVSEEIDKIEEDAPAYIPVVKIGLAIFF